MTELSVYEQNIYNTFLKVSRDGKGFRYRKNFDNLSDEKFTYIKKISHILSNKKIDPHMYFTAPYKMYSEEYINLKFFTTFNAISSYKKYIESIQLTEPDHNYNITQLRNSFKHIFQVCFDRKLKDCNDYLKIEKGLYPQYILDLKDGRICYYSLLSLGLSEKSINLEKNTVEFVCKNFYNLLSSLRSRLVFSKKIKPLSIKLIKTINKILRK
jgi:hypothetical protein